jgi:arylsulfatase A-like enzyme
LGTKDSYESYRMPWANASNTPFRLYKSDMHEGGISTPCVVSWPDGIKHKGSVIDIPTHIIDLMPTFLEISGAKYPEVYNGINIVPLPGQSLVEIFQNKVFADRQIFWEHEANRAVRWGQWKIVSRGVPQPPYEGPWEMYDMSVDRLETNDLALAYPEKLSEMEQMWVVWASENRVFPLNGTNIPTRFRTFGRKEHGYHRN